MTIRVERSIPLWGVICAIGALLVTGVSVVWHVSDIAHDVATMRDVGLEIRGELRDQNARLATIEGRLTRVETIEQQQEMHYGNEKAPYPQTH